MNTKREDELIISLANTTKTAEELAIMARVQELLKWLEDRSRLGIAVTDMNGEQLIMTPDDRRLDYAGKTVVFLVKGERIEHPREIAEEAILLYREIHLRKQK